MLGYLDEVARCGSIRRAADRLGISASSINRQIIALEEEYGLALFERLPRRLRLTVAGELLIAHVRQTLREQEVLRSRFVDLEGRRRGLVRIATIGGIIPTFAPALLDWMRESLPYVKLVVRSMSLDAVVSAVLAGEVELGLGYQLPPDPKLRMLARVPSRVGVVMAPDHPLAGKASLSLSDCIGFPMVIPDMSITIGALMRDALEMAAIGVETLAETNAIELLRRAPLSGWTLSFLSEIEAEADRRLGMLAYVPLHGPQAPVQELRLVSRRAGGLDATQSKVAEELRMMLSRMTAPNTRGGDHPGRDEQSRDTAGSLGTRRNGNSAPLNRGEASLSAPQVR
jgi:DNA-binding transcriptional LysR family regulator